MKIKNSESFNTEQCKDVREVWWACLGWAVSYCNWKTSTAERIVLPFFTIGKMRNFVFWTVVLAAVLKIWTVLSICFSSVALLLSGRMLGSRKWQIHNFLHFDYVLVCTLVTIMEEMGSRAFPKMHSLWNVSTSQCFNCEIILFE